MKRQIGTSLFERLLLSDGKANKETVLSLSKQGISMSSPQDILKDPYVFEFLGVREEKPILEKELEAKLIRHIEDFLLELGRGFMFVGSQQRITLGNVHHYVDMVFYNKILKAYVLIDLKSGAFQAEYAGQMNMYLNYYKTEVNDEADNEPIGIILCKSDDTKPVTPPGAASGDKAGGEPTTPVKPTEPQSEQRGGGGCNGGYAALTLFAVVVILAKRDRV